MVLIIKFVSTSLLFTLRSNISIAVISFLKCSATIDEALFRRLLCNAGSQALSTVFKSLVYVKNIFFPRKSSSLFNFISSNPNISNKHIPKQLTKELL